MVKKGFFLTFFVASSIPFAQKKTKRPTNNNKTPNTCNHCKVCESCGGKLEGEMVFVKGIQLVTYNEADQTTTVVYWTKKITPEQIRKEISLRGFDADEVKADPNGYKQRDGCCKVEE